MLDGSGVAAATGVIRKTATGIGTDAALQIVQTIVRGVGEADDVGPALQKIGSHRGAGQFETPNPAGAEVGKK